MALSACLICPGELIETTFNDDYMLILMQLLMQPLSNRSSVAPAPKRHGARPSMAQAPGGPLHCASMKPAAVFGKLTDQRAAGPGESAGAAAMLATSLTYLPSSSHLTCIAKGVPSSTNRLEKGAP